MIPRLRFFGIIPDDKPASFMIAMISGVALPDPWLSRRISALTPTSAAFGKSLSQLASYRTVFIEILSECDRRFRFSNVSGHDGKGFITVQ
jgi:hypothetical protein